MKQENLKRFIAIGLFAAIGLYAYFALLLSPLSRDAERATQRIEELSENIREADKAIQTVDSQRAKLDAAKSLITDFRSQYPDSHSMIWFPPRLSGTLRAEGLDQFSVDPSGESRPPGPLDKDYTVVTWRIQLPETDFLAVGPVIARIENEYPSLRIREIRVNKSAARPATQNIDITLGLIHPTVDQDKQTATE